MCIQVSFQFPSNGKDFPNKTHDRINAITDLGFNSLQTGRTFRTHVSCVGMDVCVSIPFKREGLSEPKNCISCTKTCCESFNSLQTGRTFRTKQFRETRDLNLFQFPSNGKDFPNLICHLKFLTMLNLSFNSLQTGRTFRTNRSKFKDAILDKFQFPSNGKDFPNLGLRQKPRMLGQFQFPSNGKDFPNTILYTQ